jgi:hypothetical protein
MEMPLTLGGMFVIAMGIAITNMELLLNSLRLRRLFVGCGFHPTKIIRLNQEGRTSTTGEGVILAFYRAFFSVKSLEITLNFTWLMRSCSLHQA